MRRWDTVAIVGVGLIGGSIGLALRERKLAREVVGIGRRAGSLREAKRRGAVTRTTVALARGVRDAELTVVCTPVELIAIHCREVAAACPAGALVTDAGSTKASIVAELGSDLGRGVMFLGSHPLAGSEKRGPGVAQADLFENRVVVLTPSRSTRKEDDKTLEEFWSSLGSTVVRMSPAAHDRALAATSHLPHLVAAVLAAAVPEKYFQLAAGGMADTTRVAAGDPALWRQIMLDNRDRLLEACRAFDRAMGDYRQALERRDAKTLEQLLRKAKRKRDALGN